MKRILSVAGVAVLALALVAGAQAYSFQTNLTVGSTGADVVQLQTVLMSMGYDIPAISSGAAAKGYFGSQTTAAVKQYQAAHGIPNTGFVGPMTREALNSGATTGTTGTTGGSSVSACGAGMTSVSYQGTSYCLPPVLALLVQQQLGGAVTTPTTPTQGTISTVGVPGILSVTSGPLSSIVSNVGQSMVPVLTVRVQAQYSDLAVQSMTLDLGNNTSIYNKIFNKIYVTDGNNVLASQPLNSSTVVQSGSEYIVGIAGFNYVVPAGTYKDLVIKADINPSIDSKYLSGGSLYPSSSIFSGASYTGEPSTGWGIALASGGLRAIDGAGVNLTGPGTGFAQALTINTSLVDTAQANVSLNSSSPLKNTIAVTDTTNGQYNGLPILSFDVNAQNDELHLHEAKIQIIGTQTTCTTCQVSAAYLYNGSTLITSASVSDGIADFTNITNGTAGATIPKDSTATFTVKVDITGVTSGSLAVVASTTGSTGAAPLTIYNSQDGNATVTGSAVGNTLTVANNGPVFSLVGTPTMTKANSGADTSGNSTTTYTASFNVNVQAVGTDVNLGLAASSTPAFGTTTDSLFAVYKNGVKDSLSNYTTNGRVIVVNYAQPTNTTISSDGTYFTVSRNQQVTIPVTFSFVIANAATSPNTYQAQLQGIVWEGTGASANVGFMKDQIGWRTSPAI